MPVACTEGALRQALTLFDKNTADMIVAAVFTPNETVAAERERCARIALQVGKHYGEGAVGSAIADKIRQH